MSKSRHSSLSDKKLLDTGISVEERTGYGRDGRLVRCTGIMTALNVMLLIAVVVLTVFVYLEQTSEDSLLSDGGETATCVPCKELREGLYSDTGAELDRFSRMPGSDGLEQCCTNKPSDVSVMLSLLIERKLRMEKAKGSFVVQKPVYIDASNSTQAISAEKPAAHLSGFYGLDFHDGKRVQRNISLETLKLWSRENAVSFIKKGIDYREGRLIIPSRGLYYVYSQVYFRQRDRQAGEPNATGHDRSRYTRNTFTHSVYRFNIHHRNIGDEKLLENAQSKCTTDGAHSRAEHTSYLGAVLSLRTGDEVFVKVSNIDMVGSEEKSSYFGVYLI